MLRISTFLAVALLLLSVHGCGNTTALPGENATPHYNNTPDDATGNTAQVVRSGAFTLSVLGSSFELGGSGSFSLEVREGPDTSVVVNGQASQLKAAHIRLDYPAERMHPLACEAGDWADTPLQELLQLTVLDEPGSVHHGTVLSRPQDSPGVSGSIRLLEIRFAPGAAALSRQACAAPTAAASAVPDFELVAATGECTFSYYNVGDYNQNGLVEIADITPLGIHFGEQSGLFPDPFPAANIGSVVDGNGNGLIELADLTPIGQNWDNSVARWHLYAGSETDYPASATDDNGAAALLSTIEFPGGSHGEARLAMAALMDDPAAISDVTAWLRPVAGSSEEGIASNKVSTELLDLEPPVWDFLPEGEGVMGVIPLDGALRIMWGPASDASEFSYIGWVQAGSEVDYDLAPDFWVAPSSPPDPRSDQLLELAGLANGTQYAVAVRARDVHGNETANPDLLLATPLAVQEVPSPISTDTMFEGPMIVSGLNTVLVENGACVEFMSDLTIDPQGGIEGQGDDLCLTVQGNLQCEGTLELVLPDNLPGNPANAPSMKLVLLGDVTFGPEALVTGNGNIQLVDSADELVEPEEVESELDMPPDPLDYPFSIGYDDSVVAAGIRSAAAGRSVSSVTYYGPRPWSQWLVQGNWGKVPVQPRDVHRVILRIWPVNGQLRFQDFSIEGPDGRPGTDDHSCNAHGGDGQDNKWRFRIHCGRSLEFHNVNIKLGNGGRGGNATTPADCDPGVAVGGNGGDALNKFRFTASSSISISGSMNFNPGNGGVGGLATAHGKIGDNGCLAEAGAEAFATGGNGGNVPRWGVRTRGSVFGTGNVNLGIAEGGTGGLATAWGGSGGNDTCLPGAVGGNGGYAEGTGGEGGDSTFSDGGSGAGGGGASGGTGGEGRAAGGSGGNGASWTKIPAGDGGDGAAASATGGPGGEATGSGTLTQGEQGPATAVGGNGGNGGDGLPPGVGGQGGTASAAGNPATELDGENGLDGQQSPLFLSEHIINFAASLPLGPIPPGDYLLPVLNRGDMSHIGDIMVTLYQEVPGEGEFALINYLDTTILRLEAGPNGSVGIHIDKDAMGYFNPADDAPWIGLEYSYFFASGPVGVGFWYDAVPLDDYLVPPHPLGPLNVESYFVTPGLFYEDFPPDPLVPPQWDECAVYCMPTAITIIEELVIIDP